MSWKKNLFSYILWGIYFAGTAFFFWGCACRVMEKTGMEGIWPQVCAGIICAGFTGVLFAVLRFSALKMNRLRQAKKARSGEGKGKAFPWAAIEGAMVALFLAAGLAVRIYQLQFAAEDLTYYDLAKVAQRSPVPAIAHGAVYFYVQLLHVWFYVFGNKWIIGLWLQIFLQLSGSLLFYFAVRKLAGIFPAALFLVCQMFAPAGISGSLSYSPDAFFLCVYSVGLLMAALCFGRREASQGLKGYDVILFILTGAVLGAISYLDVSGISLLVIFIGMFTLQGKKGGRPEKSRYLCPLILWVSAICFFIGCLFLDAFSSERPFSNILGAWLKLYRVKAFSPFFPPEDGFAWIFLLAAGLMTVGGLGFLCRKNTEKMTPWIGVFLSLCVMETFQITTKELRAFGLLFGVSAVLCATGLEGCVSVEKEKEPLREKAEELEERPEEGSVGKKEEEPEGITYIENPLPLPKKREKKSMDYAFIPDEEHMKYDREVDENDDFDR